MKIDTESPIPRYVQLAQWLEGRIDAGQLRPGDRVSSERELARMTGLTTMTVRQGLSELVRKGRLKREHGRGTFVTEAEIQALRVRIALLCHDLQGEIAEGYQFIVSEQIAGLQEILEPRGGALTVLNIDGSNRAEFERTLFAVERRFDGVIITGAMHGLRGFLNKAAAAGLPHVALSDPFRPGHQPPDGANFVYPDARAAGVVAAEAFIARGHQRIAYIGGNVERLAGFRAALAEKGLPLDQNLVAIDNATSFIQCERAGYQACSQLMRMKPHPTAIFAGNDYRAFGALRALIELRQDVPRQVSLIGCDDLRDCALAVPPLASIRLPHAAAARQAAQSLLEWLESPQTFKPALKPVAPELVERASLG